MTQVSWNDPEVDKRLDAIQENALANDLKPAEYVREALDIPDYPDDSSVTTLARTTGLIVGSIIAGIQAEREAVSE